MPEENDANQEVEVVEGEISAADEVMEDDATQEYRESVWEILEQAGVTKGRIVWFVVIFGLLVFGAFMVFFRDEGGGELDGGALVEVDRGELLVVETPYIVGNEGRIDIEGIPIGEFVSGGTVAVDLALSLGRNYVMAEMVQYARYLKLIEVLQNVYNTDVYAYLDASRDRAAALDEYIAELKFSIDEAKIAQQDVDAILANLSSQYDNLVVEQKNQEVLFFQAVDSLSGVEADERLQTFIVLGQEMVEVRAIHNAYRELTKMFTNVLFYLEPRLMDVEFNRAPLLDGNRVIKIDNSDIGTVIYR